MPSQRSLFSSYQVLYLLVILNVCAFLYCVNGQVSNRPPDLPFPSEAPVAGYPNEKLVKLRMNSAIPAQVKPILKLFTTRIHTFKLKSANY